jgi:hypothetical protein
MTKYISTLIVIICTLSIYESKAQENSLWKCDEPDDPFRYVTSKEARDTEIEPPCTKWVQLRGGNNLASILNVIANRQFPAANDFAFAAATYTGIRYPIHSNGFPVSTNEIYNAPESFNLVLGDIETAELGSLVLYDGLAGILVETRENEDSEWERKVIYPSASKNYDLWTSNPEISGKKEPFSVSSSILRQ